MGIPKGVLHPYASLPLGTFGVSPLNMAAAYGTLAADGVRHDPYYVERIEDRSGNVLYQHQQRGEQVVFPAIARSAISIMKGVLTDGTGVKARLADREAAGKTGTTNNSADVWFVGFTPELSTAVWIGSPLGDTESVRLNGKLQVGGDFPAQIWHQFMTDALAATPPTSFPAAPAPKSRPVNRIILPGDECWATTPTISDPANPPAALGPADYSIKAPPASATLDPRLRAIPMVPNDTTSVVKCGSIFPGIGGGATPSVADTTTTTPGSPVTTPASPVTTPASAPPTVPRTAATVPPATTTTVNRGP
jgi:penicillin-binding protein 1A